ncbi:hypothetical protein E4T56_gene17016 [Termitomyces sp. T112]|nr:hypothetical protein E4T56_gene17016 [Termitomyces sp. T112]
MSIPFLGWRKPLLYQRPGEGGRDDGYSAYQRFCVGPDARVHMWYRRRSQLDVDRGPYKSAEAVLVAAARKELAHLEQFGRPLLPFQRERREAYGREEQLPSDHIKNLERYLLIASSLVPKNSALHHFRIRHPDHRVNVARL